MALFKSKPKIVEANLFHDSGGMPLGVRSREDGTFYVVTIQDQEVTVSPGEWIILEDPPGDGTRAYPVKASVFDERYDIA